MRQPKTAPGTGRLGHCQGSADLRSKVDGLLHSVLSEAERKNHGCQYRLFFRQFEYCENLVFHKRAALDAMGERFLGADRTIG
jgi:hypothetical protein